MSTGRTIAVASAVARDLSRRVLALAFFFGLPMALYGLLAAGGPSASGWAPIAGTLMLGWGVAATAFFAALAAREMDPRLVLAGYQPVELMVGRLVPIWLIGGAAALVAFAIMALFTPLAHGGRLLGALVLAVSVAAPFGLAVAAALPQELEGVLIMMAVVMAELVTPKLSGVSVVFPFFGVGELVAGALGWPGATVYGPVAVSAGWAIALLGLAVLAWRTPGRAALRANPSASPSL